MKNEMNDIKKILVLGAGTMGLQIGLLCAASGFDVTIYDVFEQALEEAKARLQKLAEKLKTLEWKQT